MAKATAAFYTPCWEGPIAGYATNFMQRQLWRVEPDLDLEDLMQEAYLFYLICEARYKVREAKHFMALYQTCLRNRLHRLAAARTKAAAACADCAEEPDLAQIAVTTDGNLAARELQMAAAEAPDDIYPALAAQVAGTARRRPAPALAARIAGYMRGD